MYQDNPGLSNRARMAYPSHLAAGTGALLHAGNASMTCGPGGTRVGRFRESSGGQTDYQQEMEGTLQELSVHRVSSRNHGYKDDACTGTIPDTKVQPYCRSHDSKTRTRDPLLQLLTCSNTHLT